VPENWDKRAGERRSVTGNPRSPRLEVEIPMPRRIDLDAKTGVGSLEVTGEVGGVRVESGVGDVKLRRLSCAGQFPLPNQRRGAYQFGGTRAGDLNGGGPAVRVNVGVGDARLERQ
jgi:hypothetical protein